jgi:hypothetical protein
MASSLGRREPPFNFQKLILYAREREARELSFSSRAQCEFKVPGEKGENPRGEKADWEFAAGIKVLRV